MGFATVYLRDRAIYNTLIECEPEYGTGLIVTVPSFDEKDINSLLDSLAGCYTAECTVEVLVGVNAPPDATEEQVCQNTETIKNIESWNRINSKIPFRLFAFNTGRSSINKWGAGLARKVLMDEAIRRFNQIENPHGIIASLDADCLVSQNYLTELCRIFKNEKLNGISISFEHLLPCEPGDNLIRSAIIDYELHLRYYYQALLLSGYPYVYHTLGSAFAVRASAYVKVSGMNRRQAGEDFYFIQKMVPLGGFAQVNSIVVYPSARMSNRVPFGTGPSIKSILDSPDRTWYTYNPHSFIDLSLFINLVPVLFEINGVELEEAVLRLPEGISQFLMMNNISGHMEEIKSNTSGKSSYEKRFFRWFNMFQVVKYLNYVHSTGLYEKVPVSEAAKSLLGMISDSVENPDREWLLNSYRLLEVESTFGPCSP